MNLVPSIVQTCMYKSDIWCCAMIYGDLYREEFWEMLREIIYRIMNPSSK